MRSGTAGDEERQMENDANSIVKQSVVLTAKLVGGFALWVAILSFVLVSLTGRMVSAIAGSDKAAISVEDTVKSKNTNGVERGNSKPAPAANANKSNG